MDIIEKADVSIHILHHCGARSDVRHVISDKGGYTPAYSLVGTLYVHPSPINILLADIYATAN